MWSQDGESAVFTPKLLKNDKKNHQYGSRLDSALTEFKVRVSLRQYGKYCTWEKHDRSMSSQKKKHHAVTK